MKPNDKCYSFCEQHSIKPVKPKDDAKPAEPATPAVESTAIVKASSHVSKAQKKYEGFTKREVERARKAKELFHILGAPSAQNFWYILQHNLIKNCPVTVQDAINADKIFGPDIYVLKGRSTRPKPRPMIDDHIVIPREIRQHRKALTAHFDLMFASGQGLLTFVDTPVYHRVVAPINNKTDDEIYQALDSVLRWYNSHGFYFKKASCDREFGSLMDPIKDDLNIRKIDYTTSGAHESVAERNNCTIKEHMRITFHRMGFPAICTLPCNLLI